jgi:ADP-ribosylglycohydrolase
MGEFVTKQEEYTDSGDKFNSGNGSLMRLAPIPITFRKNV